MLIANRFERDQRAAEKRAQILSFLADETWTTQEVLAQVLGVGSTATVRRTLNRLERDGMVRQHEIGFMKAGPTVRIWGITSHGLLMGLGDDSLAQHRNPFDPSRISFSVLPHQVQLQFARVAAESAGWCGWTRGERLGAGVKKRPDALVSSPTGETVAIELELTAKTSKRYQQIIGEYLLMASQGECSRVAFICERKFGIRLKKLFHSQRVAYYATNGSTGQRLRGKIDLNPNHLTLFEFYDLAGWPSAEAKL